MGSIYRNSEGYYDPTAGKAIRSVERTDIKAGDIIKATTPNGREKRFAVLAVKGSIMTGIELRDECREGSVQVLCQGIMYAQPERLEHLYFTTISWEYIRTMSEDEIRAEMEAAAEMADKDLKIQSIHLA